jgi:hypothetical protein
VPSPPKGPRCEASDDTTSLIATSPSRWAGARHATAHRDLISTASPIGDIDEPRRRRSAARRLQLRLNLRAPVRCRLHALLGAENQVLLDLGSVSLDVLEFERAGLAFDRGRAGKNSSIRQGQLARRVPEVVRNSIPPVAGRPRNPTNNCAPPATRGLIARIWRAWDFRSQPQRQRVAFPVSSVARTISVGCARLSLN